jgi:hypothetical protein
MLSFFLKYYQMIIHYACNYLFTDNSSILAHFQEDFSKTSIDSHSLSGGLKWNSRNGTWSITIQGTVHIFSDILLQNKLTVVIYLYKYIYIQNHQV